MLKTGVKGKESCRRSNRVMTIDSTYYTLSFLLWEHAYWAHIAWPNSQTKALILCFPLGRLSSLIGTATCVFKFILYVLTFVTIIMNLLVLTHCLPPLRHTFHSWLSVCHIIMFGYMSFANRINLFLQLYPWHWFYMFNSSNRTVFWHLLESTHFLHGFQ